MKKILFLILVISTSVFANVSIKKVDVDICIDTTKYPNKSFKKMKEIIVGNIQEVAFNKFYKDKTSTDYKGELTKTQREELSVDVKDMYDNGTNFCNKAIVSIKEEKLNYFLPQRISLDRICHKDENLSSEKLKEKAEAKAYKEIVSQISKKEITDEQAKLLVHNYEKKDGKMYMAKGAYCLSASGDVVPFEIDSVLSKKSDNTANENPSLLKNKMVMIVQKYGEDKETFEINFLNNGSPKFSYNVLQYFENALRESHLSIILNSKLLIPNDIKGDTVTVSVNGEAKYGVSGTRYSSYINGKEINGTTYDVKVINENGLKFINLDIAMFIEQGGLFNFKKWGLPEFNSLSFNINSNTKLTPAIIKSETIIPISMNHTKNSKLNNSNLSYRTRMFDFDKEQISYFKNVLRSDSLNVTFNTKLLIPNDIKGDIVTVSVNGGEANAESYDNKYKSYINGKEIKENLYDISVINKNGLRYVNLDMKLFLKQQSFHMFNTRVQHKFSALSFIVAGKNSNKWYSLIPYNENKDNEKTPSYIVNSLSTIYIDK